MTDEKRKSSNQTLEKFVLGLGLLVWTTLRISSTGLYRKVLKKSDYCLALLIFYSGTFLMVYWKWRHLLILNLCFPKIFTASVVEFLVTKVPKFVHFLVLAGIPTILLGLLLGIGQFLKIVRFQRELKHIGLKSSMGLEPKVVEVQEPDDFKKRIIIASQGVGVENYRSRKSDLESAFGAIVEHIRVSPRSRRLVEIHLAEKELPVLVNYSSCISALTEPCSFVVGESLGGLVTQSIRTLPHLMLAGTSGGGKSVFFNQSLISFLRTTPHIQLYLLDLKLGVEVAAYKSLPNARIAKDGVQAVHLLEAVVSEMHSRFRYLEKSGHKIIDPARDNRDIIIVAVDEASVLYKKKTGDRNGNTETNAARDLTDEITKLGRAAGIHLIAATQKVTSKTIETDVQENIGGRVCFRVGTLQGSNTVLGNKLAYELPAIKGRAIWARGNDFIEVQTPFLSEEMIEEEIERVKEEFKNGTRKCLQGMIADRATDLKSAEKVYEKILDEPENQ